MSGDYLQKRKKLRFNMVVLSLFCFIAVLLAVIYGASFLAFYWVTGSQTVGVISFVAALGLAVAIMGLWLRITLKLRSKLKSLDNSVAGSVVA